METKRFIVEIGSGADLHGEDVTKAACRAVKDAISRSCLCGLVEILGIDDLQAMQVDIEVACPKPDEVDLEQVKAVVPIGHKNARAVEGGMNVKGLCVPDFAPNCDRIIVANAAVTVSIRADAWDVST
ncbi:Lin0512 family protein [Desulfococcaceae bacterium HSG7]|nr:Lin0512 family protein [Desulfococcaceae bacterium HSG7]